MSVIYQDSNSVPKCVVVCRSLYVHPCLIGIPEIFLLPYLACHLFPLFPVGASVVPSHLVRDRSGVRLGLHSNKVNRTK